MFYVSTIEAMRRLQRQVMTIGLAGVAGGSLRVAADQHKAIAEAIAAGEAGRAEELMAEHVDMTAQRIRVRNAWVRGEHSGEGKSDLSTRRSVPMAGWLAH